MTRNIIIDGSITEFQVSQCRPDNSESAAISEWWVELILLEVIPRFQWSKSLFWAIFRRLGSMRIQVASIHSMMSHRRRVFGVGLSTICFSLGMISRSCLTKSLIPKITLRERSIWETIWTASRLNAGCGLAPSHFDRRNPLHVRNSGRPKIFVRLTSIISSPFDREFGKCTSSLSWRTMILSALRRYAESILMALG
jgi:hypothetical protein